METMGRRVQIQAAVVLCCLLLVTSPPAALGICIKDCMSKRCGPNPSSIHCFFQCDSFCDPFGYAKVAVPKSSAGAIVAAPQLPGGGGVPAVSARKLKPVNGESPKN